MGNEAHRQGDNEEHFIDLKPFPMGRGLMLFILQLPNKLELVHMLQTKPEEMDRYKLRRAKRLITLDDIREANALKTAEQSFNTS